MKNLELLQIIQRSLKINDIAMIEEILFENESVYENLEKETLQNILFILIQYKKEKLIKKLLDNIHVIKRYANIYLHDLLFAAVDSQNSNILFYIINFYQQTQSNMNEENNDKNNVLQYYVLKNKKYSDLDMIDFLLRSGIFLYHQNKVGNNFLHMLVQNTPYLSTQTINMLTLENDLWTQKNFFGLSAYDMIQSFSKNKDWRNFSNNKKLIELFSL